MFRPNPAPSTANLIAFNFLLIAFLTGIASAFQTPTLSLFLSQELQVSPFLVGLFYAVNALIGIVLSQILARYSDRLPDRRQVMIFCCLIAVLGCLLFAFNRNYYILILVATTLLGLGSAANPQSFALAREYAESSGRETVMFTTIMRTQISLAWIVGPPLSFFIALNWGFDYLYLVSAGAFLLCALVSRLLPQVPRRQTGTQVSNEPHKSPRKSVTYLFIANLLLWTCNSMYLINMPLFVIHELHLDKELAGTLMGTAAGLEIPIMLFAGWLSRYWAKKNLMLAALIAGLLFYCGMSMAEQTWQLVALQLLNAIFIGITATIGMVYFQDLMPEQMGSATTLFSNAAKSSWVLGGPIAGLIAEYWSYQSVLYISLGLIAISLMCMSKVKSV